MSRPFVGWQARPVAGRAIVGGFPSRPLGVNCAPGSGVKRLFILRHAKSSWSDTSLGDWQRPLNERGLRDAPRVGDLLRQRALVPDLIITSDAVRARATALAVAQSAGYTGELVVEPSLYHAKPDDVIAVLNSMADQAARSVMIVGHNPGLEDLVRQLTGEYDGLPTATLVQLALPIDRWTDLDTAAGATLVDAWQPKQLPE
jgi:phosphohistidine phosphatase